MGAEWQQEAGSIDLFTISENSILQRQSQKTQSWWFLQKDDTTPQTNPKADYSTLPNMSGPVIALTNRMRENKQSALTFLASLAN